MADEQARIPLTTYILDEEDAFLKYTNSEKGLFQAICLAALQYGSKSRKLNDTTANKVSTSFKIKDPDQGMVVTFKGTGLSGDAATNTFTGTVTSITVNKIGQPGKMSTLLLPVPTSLQAFNDAADASPAKFSPQKSKAFIDLIMPANSPFPNLFFTGNNSDNAGLGFNNDDTFNLFGGNDIVFATKGDDTVNGGNGSDTYDARWIKASINISLKGGTAKFGTNTTALDSVENAVGTTRGDTLNGNNKANVLLGNRGNDKVNGLGGNDKLGGHQGNDVIRGGAGKDLISGGQDNDRLFGGTQADTFLFSGKKNADNGVDRIKDWQVGVDKIKIDGGKRAEVKVSTHNGNTIVKYDEGKIIIEDEVMTKSDIDLLF